MRQAKVRRISMEYYQFECVRSDTYPIKVEPFPTAALGLKCIKSVIRLECIQMNAYIDCFF